MTVINEVDRTGSEDFVFIYTESRNRLRVTAEIKQN